VVAPMKSSDFQGKLSLIANFGYQIAHEKQLDKLIELLAEQVRVILEADRCSIFIVDKNNQKLWAKITNDVEGSALRLPISHGVAGYVAQTGKVVNIVDAYNDPNFNYNLDIKTGYTKSILAMAMKNTLGQVLGVFQVLNKHKGAFTPEDEGLLNLLGSIAAAALENVNLYENIRKSEYETISRLALVTQLRDPNDLAGHLKRISEYSKLIALEMGLSVDRAEIICFASLLHDIGKVGVPDNILLLRRKLTADEYEEMKMHTIYGAKVLDHPVNELLKVARDVAIAHHENYDGSGYPFGLRKDGIPLEARIVSVADVFDALMSRRVYKEGWELSSTLEYIKDHSSKKFDPQVVEALLKCLPKICDILEREKDVVHESKCENNKSKCG
jgi:HD-GYP domain-containing protein (c-di-GMP phosphodiesterase class II)